MVEEKIVWLLCDLIVKLKFQCNNKNVRYKVKGVKYFRVFIRF